MILQELIIKFCHLLSNHPSHPKELLVPLLHQYHFLPQYKWLKGANVPTDEVAQQEIVTNSYISLE